MRPRTERSQTRTGCNCAKGRFQIFDGIFFPKQSFRGVKMIVSRGGNDDFWGLYRYCPCLRDRTANQISGYSGRNNLDYSYLCGMAKKSNTSLAYKTLLNIILPDGILEIFEVSNVREEHTGIIEETGLELRIIHIHLDERDLRVKEWHDLRPNGFTEEHCINDFPIRDRKVVLHVRRRRWLDDEGKNVILPHEGLTAPGTSYSKEFADVLKKIFGCLPDTGPLSGAVL